MHPYSRSLLRMIQLTSGLALVACTSGCAHKPTMVLNHAEIAGVSVSLPPSIGVLMNLYLDVYNPNSYDVAVRAVRGQVTLSNRHVVPVDFRAEGEGLWLKSSATTTIMVPVQVPVQIGLAVIRESYASPTIPYHFAGKADVTATRTFQLEKDDYSVSADGTIQRDQIAAVIRTR